MDKVSDSNTKQAFWLGLGNLMSFGFVIISSMILSRYFNKEDYGTYKQVMYVYTTLLTVFTLGLPKAFSYFLPRVNLEKGKSLVNKITLLFFILGIIFSISLFISSPLIAVVMKNNELNLAMRIFSPVPFLMLPTMGLESIYATYRKTHISAIYSVLSKAFMLLCVALPVLLFKCDYIVALWGFLVASLFNFILAILLSYSPFKEIKTEDCKISYKEIFNYSLPLMLASIWGILISSADQFFISRYFGAEVFADFSNGSFEIPIVGMIIGACSTVLTPLFSRMNNENLDPQISILPIWRNVFKKTAMLIYPIVIFCVFFSESIMIVLYGQKYISSADFFQIKVVVNFFTLISYSAVVMALGKVRFYSRAHALNAVLVISLEYLSVSFINNPLIIVVVSVLCKILLILSILKMIANEFKVSLLDLFPIGTIIKILLPSIIILFIFKSFVFIDNSFIYLGAALLFYLILFSFFSRILKLDYMAIVKPLLKSK